MIYTKNNFTTHLLVIVLGLSSNAFSTKKVIDDKDQPQEKKNSQKKGLRKKQLSKSLKKLQENAGSSGFFGAYLLPPTTRKKTKKPSSPNSLSFSVYNPNNKKHKFIKKSSTPHQQHSQPKTQVNVSQTFDANFENFVKNYQMWMQQQLQKNTQHDEIDVFIVTEKLEDLLKKDPN